MAILGALVGVGELGYGIYKDSQASDEAASALAKRKPYQTPAELYKILEATQNAAQTGFAPEELKYLTTQNNQAFDSSLYTDQLLGGDPNSASALFNNKIDAIMKTEGADHTLRMENFSKYLGAEKMIADSKDAEFFSQQSLVKDLQQKAAIDKQNATGQINAGLNDIVGGIANAATSDLFTDTPETTNQFKTAYGDQWQGAYDYAKTNNLSFKAYDKKSNKNLKTLSTIL